MSTHGILFVDLLGFMFTLLIIQLVRRRKLHAGYAVIWLLTCAAVLLIVSVRPVLELVTQAVGALFPASALSLLAFAFVFAVLIFFSVKLSQLSATQTELVHRLALDELGADEESASRTSRPSDGSDQPSPEDAP